MMNSITKSLTAGIDMSEEGKKELSVTEVDGLGEHLAKSLLDGKLISYRDSQYQVTSGSHEILMKLLQDGDEWVIFYVHVPYAYPMPDGVRSGVKSNLEAALKKTIKKIEFINAGTEAQKRDIQFRLELGGEMK